MEFSDDEVLVGKILFDLTNHHSCIEGRQINKYLDDLEMHLTNLPDTFENRKLDNFLMCMRQFSKDSTSQNSVYLWGLLPGWTWSAKNINLTKYDFSKFGVKNVEDYKSLTFHQRMYDEMVANYYVDEPIVALKIQQFVTFFEDTFFNKITNQVIDAFDVIKDLTSYLSQPSNLLIGDLDSIMEFSEIMHILEPVMPKETGTSTEIIEITPVYLSIFWSKLPEIHRNDPTTVTKISGSKQYVIVLGALLAYQKTLTN